MNSITAAPESMRRPSPMSEFIKAVIAVFLPKPPPGHPWSAYKPETYRAGAAPAGIVIATRARSLLSETSMATVQSLAESNLAPKVAAPSAQDEPAAAAAVIPATPEALVASEISTISQPPAAVATLPPAIAAHQGLDLALAARLQSVAVLNRRSSTTRDRRDALPPRRSRKIEPPAVLRKPRRRSAEVIQFDLALARAERAKAQTARRAA